MVSKNELVVKSNRLVEASYRLTLAEQRIILLAIVEARRTGKGLNADDFVDIAATVYAEMFDIPLNQAYEQIKEAGETLFRRYVVLHDIHPESGKPRKTEVRWLAAASYIDGAGTIQLRFAPDMVPFITRLEAQFTRYKLEKIANMSSAYAIRLYELLMQWGSVGRREVELQWLRKVLQLQEEYQSIKDFKKWVIDVALSQINEHSDLAASYTQRKTGRNVTHLIFTFSAKEEAQPAQAAQETPPAVPGSPLFQRLRNLGIAAKLAAAWLKQDEPRVSAAVEYVEARVKNGQIKGSAAGYLRTLFESGAELGPSAFEAGLKAQAVAAADAQKRAESERQAKQRAERQAEDNAKDAINALPPETVLAFAAAYRQGDGAANSASWSDAKGAFGAALERLQFKAWLLKQFKAGQAAA
jgi:hypothetical protein